MDSLISFLLNSLKPLNTIKNFTKNFRVWFSSHLDMASSICRINLSDTQYANTIISNISAMNRMTFLFFINSAIIF